jgi:hypothetical protein
MIYSRLKNSGINEILRVKRAELYADFFSRLHNNALYSDYFY